MAKETGKRFKIPTPLFDTKSLSLFEAIIVNEYRKITFDKSNPKMADGRSFPKYSKGYAKQKKSGSISVMGGKTSVQGGYENSTAPVVRGDLMLDTDSSFSVRDNAIYIGWVSHANKLEWLRKNKRILTSRQYPINPNVIKKVMPSFNKELKRRMPKGKHTITIGKKK